MQSAQFGLFTRTDAPGMMCLARGSCPRVCCRDAVTSIQASIDEDTAGNDGLGTTVTPTVEGVSITRVDACDAGCTVHGVTAEDDRDETDRNPCARTTAEAGRRCGGSFSVSCAVNGRSTRDPRRGASKPMPMMTAGGDGMCGLRGDGCLLHL